MAGRGTSAGGQGSLRAGASASQAEGRGFDPRLPLQTCPPQEDTISGLGSLRCRGFLLFEPKLDLADLVDKLTMTIRSHDP